MMHGHNEGYTLPYTDIEFQLTKTVMRLSYIYDGNADIGRMVSLSWDSPQNLDDVNTYWSLNVY